MSRFASALFNLALAGAAVAVLVLLYGLGVRTFTPRTAAEREQNPGHLLGDRIQVEVRNGAGEPGLARTVTFYLRRRGFDVVEARNHDRFDEDSSYVLDRVGEGEAARRVAQAMGIPARRIRRDVQDDYYLDASVVVGRDFAALPPFEEEARPDSAAAPTTRSSAF